MRNGNVDYFKRYVIFYNKEELNRFICLYKDLFSKKPKASYLNNEHFATFDYLDGRTELIFFTTKEDWKEIMSSNMFSNKDIIRTRGVSRVKYTG